MEHSPDLPTFLPVPVPAHRSGAAAVRGTERRRASSVAARNAVVISRTTIASKPQSPAPKSPSQRNPHQAPPALRHGSGPARHSRKGRGRPAAGRRATQSWPGHSPSPGAGPSPGRRATGARRTAGKRRPSRASRRPATVRGGFRPQATGAPRRTQRSRPKPFGSAAAVRSRSEPSRGSGCRMHRRLKPAQGKPARRQPGSGSRSGWSWPGRPGRGCGRRSLRGAA
jgi:hypothetical protein